MLRALSLATILTLTACNPFYVLRATYEESRILLGRRDIEEVIADPITNKPTREKLELVLEAREFSKSKGFTPKRSFTQFSEVGPGPLAWVLVVSRPDDFSLYTWWFPIVGSVPYKGYFAKNDAVRMAKLLEEDGYETSVRGTDAFSTLGWFDDPLLSTTLMRPEVRLVNTVLHEITHSTIWIPGHVDFNESLANFIGFEATVEFFEAKLKTCGSSDCEERFSKYLNVAQAQRDSEYELARSVTALYEELKELYTGDSERSHKLKERHNIFERHVAPLRVKYPKLELLKEINNAEIMQLKLYMTKLELFLALWEKNGRSWRQLIDELTSLEREAGSGSDSPFALLEERTKSVLTVAHDLRR